MAIFTIYLLTALLTTSIHALSPSERALEVNPLAKRAATAGGWALLNPTCLAGSQSCDRRFCCPEEMECNANGYGHHCCPTGIRCLAAYQSSPQCADDSWSLWKAAKTVPTEGWFCCLPGQIGTNAYTCVTSNTPVVASLSASLVSSATGAAAASSSSVRASSSSSVSLATTTTTAAVVASPSSSSSAGIAPTQTQSTVTPTSGAEMNAALALGQLMPVGMLAGAFALMM